MEANDSHHKNLSNPDISLIVPAYNEEAYLPALFASIDAARRQYSANPDVLELIVANNGSTDMTSEIATRHGCKVVDIPERSIGGARNGGAAVARGAVLCFVDADATVHPDTLTAITNTIRNPDVVGGATGVRPERSSLPLRLLALLAAPSRMLGADWGLVFCRRSAFEAIAGYRADLLAGEDIDFVLRLRKCARAQGRRIQRLKGVQVTASTRRFDKHGHWRFLGITARLAWWRVASPRRFEEQVRRYWYDDR